MVLGFEIVMTGTGFTVTVIVAVSQQLVLEQQAITVYVVVVVAEYIKILEVVFPPGLHEYDTAPLQGLNDAYSPIESPLQTVVVPGEFTVTVHWAKEKAVCNRTIAIAAEQIFQLMGKICFFVSVFFMVFLNKIVF